MTTPFSIPNRLLGNTNRTVPTRLRGSKKTVSPAQMDFGDLVAFTPSVIAVDSGGGIWTTAGIDKLKRGLLKDGLAMLIDGRASKSAKREILDWMKQTDEFHPFSFVNCAKAADCCTEESINNLRQGIIRAVRTLAPKNLPEIR